MSRRSSARLMMFRVQWASSKSISRARSSSDGSLSSHKVRQRRIVFISHHTEAREVTEEQSSHKGSAARSSQASTCARHHQRGYRPRIGTSILHFSDATIITRITKRRPSGQSIDYDCNLRYGEMAKRPSSYRRSSARCFHLHDRLKNRNALSRSHRRQEDVYPALSSSRKKNEL